MPKFKTAEFHFEDREDTENRIKFKTDINIAADGLFYTTLPPEVLEILGKAFIHPGKLFDKSYKGLGEQIGEIFAEYFSKELVSEQMLLKYFIATSASYCKSADGEFLPNGEWQRQKDGQFSGWINGIGPNTIQGTGVSVYCVPINRKVFQYKSGRQLIKDEQVHANYARDFGKENLDDNLYWLACKPETQNRLASSEFQYIEATPEVCAFFVGLYKSLWSLNERIKQMTSPEQPPAGKINDKILL